MAAAASIPGTGQDPEGTTTPEESIRGRGSTRGRGPGEGQTRQGCTWIGTELAPAWREGRQSSAGRPPVSTFMANPWHQRHTASLPLHLHPPPHTSLRRHTPNRTPSPHPHYTRNTFQTLQQTSLANTPPTPTTRLSVYEHVLLHTSLPSHTQHHVPRAYGRTYTEIYQESQYDRNRGFIIGPDDSPARNTGYFPCSMWGPHEDPQPPQHMTSTPPPGTQDNAATCQVL